MKSETGEKTIIIVGATAVGKTTWAISYAIEHAAEIISADSMQIYKEMNIGTAKPSLQEQELVPHHLIDTVYPDESYSVYDFVKQTEVLIPKIKEKGRKPVIVGGTGLYINAFIHNFKFPSIPKDPGIQQGLSERASKMGIDNLYEELTIKDPVSADKINKNDLYRIKRALEVLYITGKPLSSFHNGKKEARNDIELWWINTDRQELYNRIEQRVDGMIDKGLLSEVEQLLSRGYSPQLTALQALGYKESIAYLEGKITKDECIDLIKKRTRNFAKRQLTWFRSFPISREIHV